MVKPELTVRAKFADFSEGTTLHGLKYIGRSRNKLYSRVVWLCLLLFMLAMLLFHFIKGFTVYRSYPTTTKLNVYEEDSLSFPTVTICNTNMIRQPYIDEHPLVGNVTSVHAPEIKLTPMMNLSEPSVIEDMKAIVFSDIFRDGGHTFTEMFGLCLWDGIQVNCSDVFTKRFTDNHGLCFSFNSDSKLVTRAPGNLYGLELVLNLEQFLYSHMATSPGAGIKLVLHGKSTHPMFEEKALLLTPGLTTELKFRRKQDIFLPSPYEGPGCHEGNEYRSLTDCKILCFNKYLTSECGCQALPVIDSLADYRNCSLFDYHVCVVKKTEDYRFNKTIEKACGCLHHCTEVDYDVTQTHMLFPSHYAAQYFNVLMGVNVTAQGYRENMVHLKIYYGNLLTTVTEQVCSYTFANLAADTGGYMGLFLGASLLTLSELVEFILKLFKAACCRKKSTIIRNSKDLPV